jgi:hypothetical protein
MKHRLIIVDGHSTVGKSTTSKSVYRQIRLQDRVNWLHEECEKHPIRYEEFIAGSLHSREGMELNRQAMLSKWRAFSDDIIRSDEICITEGCLLHAMDRYLVQSVWDEEQIMDFYNAVLDVIEPLKPLVVFLHRPDIKSSFERAFKLRGDWWKNLILSVPGPYGFFQNHVYAGDESVYESLYFEQNMMLKVFETLFCSKIKIDTTEERWNDYVQEITETAGYDYHEEETELPETEGYCGIYQICDGDDTWEIRYDTESGQVFTSLFWPYMPMRFLGDAQFELISFPVTMKFDSGKRKTQFTIEGNYDWNYNGKTFLKIG